MTGRPRGVSLRRRLVVGMVALVGVGLLVAGVATYYVLQTLLVKKSAISIRATVRAAAATIDAAGGPGADPGRVAAALTPLLANGEVLAWRPVGRDPVLLLAPGLAYGPEQRARLLSTLLGPPPAPDSLSLHRVEGVDYQVTSQPTSAGQLAVAASMSDVDKTMYLLLVVEALVGGAVLVGMAWLGVFVVRRGLRPLEAIVDTAGAITRGDRSRRIALPGGESEVGRVSAALNVMLDETEASFAAQRASEARLRQFVADASHELRTPLASVRSYAELLRSGAAHTPADRGLAMDRIESESVRMSELVEDLLLLARLDMGRPLRAEPVELAGLVRDAVDDEDAIDPTRPRTVRVAGRTAVLGDANRLRQVLGNLLTNARAHTPPGTPVEIVVLGGDEPGAPVRLVVADRGPGLSARDATRAFERFYRADSARTHRPDTGAGVGLGLSIVAAIVAAHRGTVALDATPGGGTRCTVTLPGADTLAEGDGRGADDAG